MIGEAVPAAAALVWAILVLLYARKWIVAWAARPLRMAERDDTGPAAMLVPPLFIAANLAVVILTLGALLLQGKLVPKPAPVVP